MKKLLISIAGIFLLSLTPIAFAGSGHDDLPSLKKFSATLEEKYNVKDLVELKVSEVSEDDLELLGDILMERMAGSSKHHEWMDKMHGGEGSEELKKLHINIAKDYLEDGSSYQGIGKMGHHMMGWNTSSKYSGKSWSHGMHGGYSLSIWHGLMFIGHIILWVAGVAVTVFIARKVWDMSEPKTKKKK